MALNGLIGSGVPQDWTTHMIGHELTSLHAIDHARTLTIVLPSVMRELKDSKKDKLLQYARNVWNITADDHGTQLNDDDIIEAAIKQTENFFRELGLPVSLEDADLDAAAIDPIISQLEAHKMVKLGEHGKNDLAVSRRILERAVSSNA